MGVDPVSLSIQAALMAANMAMTASQSFEGPRLTDLSVSTADYGTALSYVYGTRVIDGTLCIWAEPLREVKSQNKTKGGKFNDYKYYGTWATLVVDQPADAVTRVWFDKHLVYDATGSGPLSPFSVGSGSITDYMRIYLGASDQMPDPAIQARTDADLGAGSTPAYRGCTYIVFDNLPLEKLGNRLPQVSVEVVTNGGPTFPSDARATSYSPFHLNGMSFSPDYSRVMWYIPDGYGAYEIWDVNARARMIRGVFDTSVAFPSGVAGGLLSMGISNDGRLWLPGNNGGLGALITYQADGTGPATLVVPNIGGPGYGVRVLQAGDGEEWVCVISGSFDAYQYIMYYRPSLGLYTRFSTASVTGTAWGPQGYLLDAHGDIWCFGATNAEIWLYRLTSVAADGPPTMIHVAGPTSGSGGVAGVCACFYEDATHDHFVVAWGGGYFVTIDRLSGTITQTAPIVGGDLSYPQMATVRPGASSMWYGSGLLGGGIHEVSLADLSNLRSVSTGDWGIIGQEGIIYDPVNNALIAGTGASDTVYWLYLDRVAGEGVTLRSIVEDVGARSGLTAGTDFAATALDQTVDGYSWTQGTGKAIVEPLLEAFDSEARPHDFLLEFRKRGGASQGTVPVAQMDAASGGKANGKRYTVTRTLDSDLPLRVDVTHADPAMDQQPNTQHAQRNAHSVDSSRAQSLDLTTLLLTVDAAKAKAESYLRRIWYGAETYDNALTRAWSKLEPGDVWTLDLDGDLKAAALQKLEFGANGVLTLNWKRDTAKIHDVTSLSGAGADGYVPPVILVAGYSKGLVLDVPLATDADDGIIAYAVAGPYSSGDSWPGATVYESPDGIDFGATLTTISPTQQGTFGYAAGVLADALTSVWDRTSTVSVQLQSGALTSTSEAEVERGANLAVLGDELLGFSTATLTAPDTYTLSGLLRGRRGTEQHTGGHASGERFVLLSGNAVRAELGASDVGDTLYFKPITTGGASGFPQALTYTAASAKPYSPVHLAAANVSGDKLISWTRRTRIGGEALNGTTPPLGETTEAYQVDILNGSGTVIRTLSGLTSPTATYTAAQQTTDSNAGVTAKVYQISSTVGRGFPASVAL